MKTGPLDDEVLIERYRKEDDSVHARKWLDELFQRYHSRVAVWCLRFTGKREEAADLAQEVFMKAYMHLDSFQGNSRFSTWLFSITRNHCFNYLKSRSRRPVEVGDEPLMDLPANSEGDVLDRLLKAHSERQALEMINTVLDETEKKVMVMHYAEEVPLDTITRVLSLENASGAKAFIVSAKRKLKRALDRSADARMAERSKL